MSWKGDMCDIETTDNLSQRPEPNGPLKSLQTRADSMRGVVAGYAKILTQPPVPITMQINEPLALDNEYSKEFLSVGRTDKENVVVETHNSFPVNVLMAWHDRAQLIDASECDGDVCYVSRKLMESYNINPEVGQACITWRKLDGDAFTHTWCEVLETSQIIGSANLILGRDRQKREWNDCETMEDVIELTRTRLPSGLLGQFDEDQHTVISEVYDIRALSKKISEDPSSESGHGDTKFSLSIATAHREIEDASEGVSDGDCSWLSSSNESSDTALDLAQERRDQIIGRIVLAVTQWLQSQFIYAHKTTNEATTGTFGCQNMPSGTLGQLSQDQAKAEGKRKLSERRGDGGEDDDDDSMRLTDVGTTDKGKTKEILRFACPYFKYNPNKYKEWPNCPGPGWPDVHRVKYVLLDA
jgi:hypothetical protein